MKVFIAGATGVFGRRLVPLLRRDGHTVTAVRRSAAAATELARHGATPVDIDLFDGKAVARAVAGHDAVINLATHIPRSAAALLPWAWKENDRLRRFASATLAQACRAGGVSRYVQESYAPTYPDRGASWIDETTPIRPVPRHRALIDAEAAAEGFARSGGAGVVLRFGTFYGPDAGQTADLIHWVARGWAPLPGPRTAYISSISHDDAAAAVLAALQVPSGAYNVVDDEPVTHAAFAESLASALGVSAPRLPPPAFAALLGSLGGMMARSLRISNAKFRSVSGWSPRLANVREGWRAVVAEMRATARARTQRR